MTNLLHEIILQVCISVPCGAIGAFIFIFARYIIIKEDEKEIQRKFLDDFSIILLDAMHRKFSIYNEIKNKIEENVKNEIS